MTAASPAGALPLAAGPPHIIDVLIAERAPRLTGSAAWPLLKPSLYGLLDYRKARRLADHIGPLGGRAALEHVSGLLSLDVRVRGLERIPREGRLVVVCNHPSSIADGVAVYDALKSVRPDVMFYANADAHRVCRRLDEVLIPVEWVEAKRSREGARLTLQRTRAALQAERCLVIFPAGRMSRRQPDGRLRDLAWAPTAISLARRHEAPVVPIHVAGPYPHLFHLFSRISPELRDVTLFHEFLNKRGRRYGLTVGAPIAPQALAGEAAEATARLKAHVEEQLPQDPERPFA